MMRKKGLQEDDIQKLHTTAPEQLTDQELLLSTISAEDLDRKHSVGWDKESLSARPSLKQKQFKFSTRCGHRGR